MKIVTNDPEYKKRQIEINKEINSRPEIREKKRLRMLGPENPNNNLESVLKITEATLKRWEDPVYRETQSNILRELNKNPEILEKQSNAKMGTKNPSAIYHFVLKFLPTEEIFETDCLSEFCRAHYLKFNYKSSASFQTAIRNTKSWVYSKTLKEPK